MKQSDNFAYRIVIDRAIIIGVGLVAAIAISYMTGHHNATQTAEAKHNKALAQAAIDFQLREAENLKHRDKARTLNDKTTTDFARAVPASSDRLLDLIQRASTSAVAACNRDAVGSAKDASTSSENQSAVSDRFRTLNRSHADAVANFEAAGLACANKLLNFATTLDAIER